MWHKFQYGVDSEGTVIDMKAEKLDVINIPSRTEKIEFLDDIVKRHKSSVLPLSSDCCLYVVRPEWHTDTILYARAERITNDNYLKDVFNSDWSYMKEVNPQEYYKRKSIIAVENSSSNEYYALGYGIIDVERNLCDKELIRYKPHFNMIYLSEIEECDNKIGVALTHHGDSICAKSIYEQATNTFDELCKEKKSISTMLPMGVIEFPSGIEPSPINADKNAFFERAIKCSKTDISNDWLCYNSFCGVDDRDENSNMLTLEVNNIIFSATQNIYPSFNKVQQFIKNDTDINKDFEDIKCSYRDNKITISATDKESQSSINLTLYSYTPTIGMNGDFNTVSYVIPNERIYINDNPHHKPLSALLNGVLYEEMKNSTSSDLTHLNKLNDIIDKHYAEREKEKEQAKPKPKSRAGWDNFFKDK